MKHRRIVLSAAIVAVSFTLAGGWGALAATLSPKTVALRATDLPVGFHQTSGVTVSNAQMASATHVPKAQFNQHGRITGYQEQFQGLSKHGAINVFANVYLYKTPAGAQWDFSESTKHDLAIAHAVAAPHIGEASQGFAQSVKSGGKTVKVFGITFHRGNYDVTVGVAGVTGGVSMTGATGYAKVVDKRIQTGK